MAEILTSGYAEEKTKRQGINVRGYFAVGVEGISKAMNAGSMMRTAHAFGANYFFTVGSHLPKSELHWADTSKTLNNLPVFHYETIAELDKPRGCQVVGVELVEDAIEMPSFAHPRCALYLLGPENGSLSNETLAACDHVIKIPTQFCINLAVAGAITLYDRLIYMGRFAPRPVKAGGPTEALPKHHFGGYFSRKEKMN